MEKPTAFATYATQLNEWSTDELLEGARQVESLKAHGGWAVLERLLRERTTVELARIVHGPIVSKAQYAAVTSLVSGMESSLLAADAVLFAAEVREREEQAAAERGQEE